MSNDEPLSDEVALENFGKSIQVVQCEVEVLRVALVGLASAFNALPAELQTRIFPSFISIPSQWSNIGVVPNITTIRNYPETGDEWVMVRGTNAAAKEQ